METVQATWWSGRSPLNNNELCAYSTMSIVTNSPGRDVDIGWSGVLCFGIGFLLCWHSSHFLHESSISNDIWGQKYLSLVLCKVFLNPKWPKWLCIIPNTLGIRLHGTTIWMTPFLWWWHTTQSFRTNKLSNSHSNALNFMSADFSFRDFDCSRDFNWLIVVQAPCCCRMYSKFHCAGSCVATFLILLRASATVLFRPGICLTKKPKITDFVHPSPQATAVLFRAG